MGVSERVRTVTNYVPGDLRRVITVSRDRDVPFMAAAVAHYTLASLVPLLLLAVSLAAIVGGEEFITSVIRVRLGSVLSASGQRVLTNALTGIEGQVGAGVIGVLAALWSGSKVFRALDVAFNELYEEYAEPTLVEQLINAVVVIGLLVLAVAALIAAGVAVSFLDLPVDNPTLVGSVSLLATLIVGLLPIYYVLTPGDPSVREVLPGTALAAVGFVLLQVVFVYYARSAGQYKALGLLGAVFLFVLWLYFGGIILLLGGVVNYVRNEE